MKSAPIDIILWPSIEANLQDDATKRNFEFYFQNQTVGKCSVRLCQNAYALCDSKQFFPDELFDKNESIIDMYDKIAHLKPFLEVTNFDFSDFQGMGFGRMGLQILYQLSQKMGGEGHIFLIAQKQSASYRSPALFYEHCGFKGNEGFCGRKYFIPSTENIKTLFSKSIHPFFKMKEILTQQNENTLIDYKTRRVWEPKIFKKLQDRQRI